VITISTSINKILKTIAVISTLLVMMLFMNGCALNPVKPGLDPAKKSDQSQTTPVEIIEVEKIVYVQAEPTESELLPTNKVAEFCKAELSCSQDELTAQLTAFTNTSAITQLFSWMKGYADIEPDTIKNSLDDLASQLSGTDAMNLLYGTFFSIPKTGHRSTSSALEYLLVYPTETIVNPSDLTFFKLLVKSLEERNQLIKERSALRKENSSLKADSFQKDELAESLNNKLRKLKQIERSMLRSQTSPNQ